MLLLFVFICFFSLFSFFWLQALYLVCYFFFLMIYRLKSFCLKSWTGFCYEAFLDAPPPITLLIVKATVDCWDTSAGQAAIEAAGCGGRSQTQPDAAEVPGETGEQTRAGRSGRWTLLVGDY